MFRKGGEVMEGIMTGIKPRKNYNQGTPLDQIIAEANLDPTTENIIRTTSKISAMGMPSRNDIIARANVIDVTKINNDGSMQHHQHRSLFRCTPSSHFS